MSFLTSLLRQLPSLGILILISLPFAQPAYAIKGDQARFTTCQQLKAGNSLKWYGIASGTEDSTYSIYEFSHPFHTRACFSNEKDCRNWVKRIRWEIPTMDELRTAYCKRS